MDLGLGRDIDALRRFIEEKHCDAPRQPFRQDHLLLVAARQRACGQRRPPRTDVDDPSARRRRDHRRSGRASQREKRVEVGQQDVVADRLVHTSRVSVRPKPCRCRRQWRRPGFQPALPVASFDGVGRFQRRRRQRIIRLGAAGEGAGQSEDLAGGQAQRGDPVRPRLQAGTRRARAAATNSGLRRASGHRGHKIVGGEKRRAGRPPRRGRREARCSGRRSRSPRRGDARCRRRRCPAASCAPARRTAVRSRAFERRRRLVEDEDAALPAKRLGDRHELALGEASEPTGRSGRDRSRAGRARRARRGACARDRPWRKGRTGAPEGRRARCSPR